MWNFIKAILAVLSGMVVFALSLPLIAFGSAVWQVCGVILALLAACGTLYAVWRSACLFSNGVVAVFSFIFGWRARRHATVA